MSYSRGGNRRYKDNDRGGRNYYSGSNYHDDRNDEEGASPNTSKFGCFPGGGPRRGSYRGRGRGRGIKEFTRRITAPFRKRTGQVDATWSKVIIPQGRSFGGRDKIVESLEDYTSEPLHPVLFRFEMGDAVFYLEDNDKANALRSANRRITTSSGQRMSITVTKAPAPFVALADNEINAVKEVLSKRYDIQQGHMDLTSFSLDPDFKKMGPEVHMALQRNNVMMAVVKIIHSNCPDVRSIDLSDNRLRFLDYFGALVYRARGVQRLILKNNSIDKPQELEKIRGWPLVEIDLDRNPMCNRFSDIAAYKSAIHKVFPKVTKLDGVDIPPPVGFGAIEQELSQPGSKKTLPTILPGFYVNEALTKLIQTFVVEYLTIYDSGPNARQNLLQAYDQDATFTLIMDSMEHPDQARYKDSTVFGDLRRDSHNIMYQERWERYRSKIINHGGINVISKLTKLPKTEHLRDSLLVDVSLTTEQLMCFTLQGLFRDGPEAGSTSLEVLLENLQDLRFFSRTFMVVQRGAGLSVVNDLLYMSPISKETAENHLQLLQRANVNAQQPAGGSMPGATQPAATPAPAVPVAASTSSLPSVAAAGGAALSPEQQKEALVEHFAVASKMKRAWSLKCLEDNEWNFDKAAVAFKNLNDSGSIPAEAWETAL